MTTLYGIKNCDTVKKARTWLDEKKVTYRFHDFRVDGLTQDQVKYWIGELGLEALVNKRSTTWKELDETVKSKFDEQSAVKVITENPTLIKRPLLEVGTQKYLGFKEAEYSNIFQK